LRSIRFRERKSKAPHSRTVPNVLSPTPPNAAQTACAAAAPPQATAPPATAPSAITPARLAVHLIPGTQIQGTAFSYSPQYPVTNAPKCGPNKLRSSSAALGNRATRDITQRHHACSPCGPSDSTDANPRHRILVQFPVQSLQRPRHFPNRLRNSSAASGNRATRDSTQRHHAFSPCGPSDSGNANPRRRILEQPPICPHQRPPAAQTDRGGRSATYFNRAPYSASNRAHAFSASGSL
jgi:hypothetical protein